MKSILRVVFPVFLLLTFLSGPVLAQQKIATVNMSKLFDGFWKTKQAENALNDRKAELDKEDRGFVDGLNKAKDEYQKLLDAANNQAISADERAKRQKAADDKLQQIQDSQTTIAQFERQAQVTLSEQTRRMRANIISEIKSAVADQAKAAGYTMVFDSTSQTINETPILLYNKGENDLTAAVLAELNAGTPIDLNTPAAASNTNSP